MCVDDQVSVDTHTMSHSSHRYACPVTAVSLQAAVILAAHTQRNSAEPHPLLPWHEC